MTEPPRRLAMINSDGKTQPPLPDPDGLVTKLYDLRLRVMARTSYDHLFTELGTVDAAEAALREGCDAIYIDTFGDYGADRIRATTSVPVVGASEASILSAAEQIRAFSIVTVWPRSMSYLYDERLRSCAGGDRCGGVHYLSDEDELERVGQSDGVKARMIRREGDLLGRLEDLTRAAVARDRTDGVLLGCTCMSPIAADLQERCSFPVLDPSRLGLEAAFRAVREEAPHPPAVMTKQAGLASAVVAAYLDQRSAEDLAFDECEVCAVTQAASSQPG